ncbi:MAG: beta-propeller domain-containing protein [Hadesarchaea archaeon]|nr:beta-propeller domain-containing protein [Hadesarchaea archaeon]
MKRSLVPAMFALLLGFGLAAAGVGVDLEPLWLWMVLILPVSAWYLIEGQRPARMWFIVVVTVAAIAAVSAAPAIITNVGVMGDGGQQFSAQGRLKKFSSHEELVNFVKVGVDKHGSWNSSSALQMLPRVAVVDGITAAVFEGGKSGFEFTIGGDDFSVTVGDDTVNISTDYSTTNIQVEGVDEADIVKCDGKYIYVVSGNKVIIIDAYPAENARILSEIEVNERPREIFINGDKLVILGQMFVKVYDISDRGNPSLKRDVSFDGWYFNSRMVGDYVYLIINSPTIYYWAEEIDLPTISLNGNVRTIQATEIYYFENLRGYSYEFTTIMAINTQNDDEEITSETILMSTAQNIFVSSNNIYITYSNYNSWGWGRAEQTSEKTVIHKISISDGEIVYKCWGEVPGRVLNQFSMDEYQGYFRIATTTGWFGANHVYVLDEDLNIVGRLEGLAEGERIYSARFMGAGAYLMTFKQVDPLFVLDLSNPHDPKVLGELKIPGYSDYLHPYDETHIIGIGKDTIDAGSFAWRQGVKISLFDVSDPENPREISRYMIGDRGTEWGDSYALSDHRAFLFDQERNLLVVPIELAERKESFDTSPWTYGTYVWQGAYVFHISLTDGLVLKGRITHSETKNQWNSYNLTYHVRRSLYIDNVLYTISGGMVKMNNLADLGEINSIELPSSAEWPPIYCYPMIE